MTAALQAEVTTLLDAIRVGDVGARNQLFKLVSSELRHIAGWLMQRERPDHTLQPTALIDEAYLRLFGKDFPGAISSRSELLAAFARGMREVLVDHARARGTQKRGGHFQQVPLDDYFNQFEKQNGSVLSLHVALEELAALDPRQAQVVELRFFGQQTVPQIAQLIGLSVSAIEKELKRARRFLARRIEELD
jgi:RNA polymerase sigma factor (TIGR02999 family)